MTLTVTNASGSNSTTRTVTVVTALAAAFSYTPTSPLAGQSVQFTDTSIGNPTLWQWSFGDGGTSTAQNPTHSYTTAGSYTVSLTVMNASGQASTTRTVTVAPVNALTASFTYSPASPAAGQSVQFTDTSAGTPTSWSWSFGDGTSSTAQNPSHTYTGAGAKTVILTATNASGSNSTSRTVTVVAALAASFSYSPASPAAGQSVQFTDTSVGSPTSWSWSFGDGTTSTAQNPSHTYTGAGAKTVTLTATNASGSNTTTRTVTVVVALTASYSFTPASPAAGQSVQFTDTSTGSPTSWSWDFNDGSTNSTQNTSHTFSSSGSYSVSLTVTNNSGSSSTSRVISVTPNSTLSASFSFSPASPTTGQSVQFTDTSTGAPTSWSWNFGDGSTSTLKNPSHSYTTAGAKTVTLTVMNAADSDSISRPITVVTSSGMIIDHTCAKLNDIPTEWITVAKQNLHIAYGHTSHGSQLITGMTGLAQWKGSLYSWNNGGTGGALDIRDYYNNFGGLGIANDLGNPDRSAWERATRLYLDANPNINVIIWSWCWQMLTMYAADIDLYLNLMNGLEEDYPNVKFVYMTGHVAAGQEWGEGTAWTHQHYMRAKQIRDYCIANNKILYDFADLDSWDPDGNWFGDKLVDDACNYDSNGDGSTDKNWAIDWQNAHPGEWYDCESAHSQPLNANLKAYAAWHLWARLAGWDGN